MRNTRTGFGEFGGGKKPQAQGNLDGGDDDEDEDEDEDVDINEDEDGVDQDDEDDQRNDDF